MTIYGSPATGLNKTPTWAKNKEVARIGAQGEVRTATLLADVESRHPQAAFFHDVVVPNSRGHRYNIDHAVVAGTSVLLIDTKVWKPGFLWTMGGKTRRGFEGFDSCDKRSVAMAHQDIERHLGARAKVVRPLVVVWPSNSKKKLSMWAAQMPGGRLVTDAQLRREVGKFAQGGAADPEIVAQLKRLLAQ